MNIFACNLSIVPLHTEPSHRSEMVSQVLFGESFEIIEEGIDFVKIRLTETKYEGWIQKFQYGNLLLSDAHARSVVDIEGAVAISQDKSIALLPGTTVSESAIQIGNETFKIEGKIRRASLADFEEEFPKLIQYFLHAPYMWGGRSIYGIDCSGFSQAVYRHFGISILRDAYQQAEGGTTVDFLPEIKAGDLAFFDNDQGRITHVGVMLDNETIIHASGKVRIDKMDNQGIFNADQNRYTHKLRIVKRYF